MSYQYPIIARSTNVLTTPAEFAKVWRDTLTCLQALHGTRQRKCMATRIVALGFTGSNPSFKALASEARKFDKDINVKNCELEHWYAYTYRPYITDHTEFGKRDPDDEQALRRKHRCAK